MTNHSAESIMQMLIVQHRDVAQVVERYFREVEAASSSLVIPIYMFVKLLKYLEFQQFFCAFIVIDI